MTKLVPRSNVFSCSRISRSRTDSIAFALFHSESNDYVDDVSDAHPSGYKNLLVINYTFFDEKEHFIYLSFDGAID